DALKGRGDVAGAIDCYLRGLGLDANSAVGHNNLGSVLCDVKHDYDGAATHFRLALKLVPNDPAYHRNLGIALMKKGRLDEAIAEYREAIRLQPDYAHAHYSLGVALQQQGHLEKAAASYRQALKHQPGFPQAQSSLHQVEKMLLQKAGDQHE